MINSEHVFNDNVTLAIRHDGFQVYILNNLENAKSLDQVNPANIKVASIKGSFNFELLSLFNQIEMLTFMDIDLNHTPIERLLDLSELKRLVLVDCILPDNVDLSRFNKLEELDLNWNRSYHFTDGCVLKDLVVRKLNTDDLSFLNCKSLETLELIQGKLSSLEGIGALSNLKALTLVNLKNLSDLDPISSLYNIEYLDLRGIKSSIDSRSILKLSRLKWLVLENCDFVMSFEALLAHQSLRGIKILKRGKFTDIEKKLMSSFPNTKYGYFRPGNIRDRLTIEFKGYDVASKN